MVPKVLIALDFMTVQKGNLLKRLVHEKNYFESCCYSRNLSLMWENKKHPWFLFHVVCRNPAWKRSCCFGLFFTCICLTFLSFIVFPVRQDWEGKADEAKKDYERAMKEYRESSGGTSKKYFTQSVHKNLTVQVSFLKWLLLYCISTPISHSIL